MILLVKSISHHSPFPSNIKEMWVMIKSASQCQNPHYIAESDPSWNKQEDGIWLPGAT